MVFSSFSFIFVFLPALILPYFLIPKRLRTARNVLLLAFSLFFYSCGGVRFLPVMIASIAVNYVGGLICGSVKRWRRLALCITVAADLGMLFWFKYAGFFAANISLLGINVSIPEIVMPIGISFFTFQGMSYAIDVYRKDAGVEKNPLKVALYISFFPQLVAGPIVRYNTVAAEIAERNESFEDFSAGAVRFVFGLTKKLIVANACAEIADAAFGTDTAALTSTFAWLGAIAYTLQIYFDFSAYSDMAIGLGRMFGFRFEENFNYPYAADSITDFWRRWHISLSTWFRDYLYIPLGGSRRSTARNIFNLAVVWLLTGFWHGAEWSFLIWGVFYFLLLIGERYIWGKLLKKVPVLSRAYTLFFVVIGWVLFRADGVREAWGYICAMFTAPFADGRTVYYLAEYAYILLPALIFCLPIKRAVARFFENRAKTSKACGMIRTLFPPIAALALLAVSYIKLMSSTFNPFIYFRF